MVVMAMTRLALSSRIASADEVADDAIERRRQPVWVKAGVGDGTQRGRHQCIHGVVVSVIKMRVQT